MRCAARVFTFFIILPVSGFGQAWVPAKGAGGLTISYQNLFVRNHLDWEGRRLPRGHIRASSISQELEYGLTGKIALNLSLPYITAKYNGGFPHTNPGNTDNGDYHGTFQDFRFGVRYNLRMRPLVVTPLVEGIIPSHGYETYAHTQVGLDLREVRVGMNLGRRLDPILPKAYFQTQYSYAVVQSTLGFRPDRSRINSEFGYFLTKRVSSNVFESLQITHSGLRFPIDFPCRPPQQTTACNNLTPQAQAAALTLWHHHDQISQLNFLNLGLGAAFAATESVEFFASALTNVWGENIMSVNRGLTFGVYWNFRTRRFVRQAFADKT